jgi:signal transduction histidine kinase
MQVTDHGKHYQTVMVGSLNVNPGYKFVNNTAYPNIAEDYEDAIKVLKSLRCDIFLGAHAGYFNLSKKYASFDIFVGDYNGTFFVSPLHPEMVGKNELNFKDSSGVLVVQEEIAKAKAGGGWLRGRWRENPQTPVYQCKKIYILPIASNYFIVSWYHYSSDKSGVCTI